MPEQSGISACFTPGGRLSSRGLARHLDAQVKALAHKNEALRLALRDQDLLVARLQGEVEGLRWALSKHVGNPAPARVDDLIGGPMQDLAGHTHG
jgi:hypothetical protein